MTKYPQIENAYEILRGTCMENYKLKVGHDSQNATKQALDKELEYVKNQGSASGFLTVINALNATEAKADEFAFKGTLTSSVIAYVLGLSKVNPVEAKPKLYSEFCFGLYGDRTPYFEMSVNSKLYKRLWLYFDNYRGKEPIKKKYDSEQNLIGVLFDTDIDSNHEEKFYINFFEVPDTKKFHEDMISKELMETFKPQTMEEYVKCYGLSMGTGVWENNQEDLCRDEGMALKDLIASREDVYEYLMDHGIDKATAFGISENVRKGKVRSRGWDPDTLETLRESDISEQFINICKNIGYLFPRAHSMALLNGLQ